jgi:hypothetical protein
MFHIILEFSFFLFFLFLNILSFKINNLLMHKDYLKFIDAYYYLIIGFYFENYLEFKK